MMKLISGNEIASEVIAELKEQIKQLPTGIIPHITVCRVGNDPASISYVQKKQQVAQEIGIKSTIKVFPETITQEDLEKEIFQLNEDKNVHAILVQSPLPSHIDSSKIFNTVLPVKDVDGFSTANLGKLLQDSPEAIPACTPAGIVELLERSHVQIAGKHILIIGRSIIVGKPLAALLLSRNLNATVTICHSKTENLAELSRQADIVIAAIGRPKFLTADMIKDGAVVIDVGINRVPDASKKNGFRLVGDVDFESAKMRCSQITPVPGGVGPMTVAMLMKNTLRATLMQHNLNL